MPPNKTHSHSEHVEGNTKKASIFTIFVCHSGLKMKKKNSACRKWWSHFTCCVIFWWKYFSGDFFLFHPSVLCLLFGGFNQIRLSEDRLKAKSHFYQKICQKYFGYTTVATFRDVGKKYLHNTLPPHKFERLFLKLGISKFFLMVFRCFYSRKAQGEFRKV